METARDDEKLLTDKVGENITENFIEKLIERFKGSTGRFRQLTAKQFGDGAEELPRLVERGLLELVKKKGGDAFKVAASVQLANKPAKPVKSSKAPRTQKPEAVTLADLHALETRLLARLDEIAALLGSTPRHAPVGNLATAIPDAIREADRVGRHGGLVPIPEVRALLLSRTAATRAQFDEALLRMERDFLVDLKIANDPRRADAAEGISVPGRGLVYFALVQ